MANFLENFWLMFRQSFSGWEGVAVILAVVYLLLAMKEKILCWYAAFISSAIYAVIFWDVSLLMESALSVYYVAMAVFGWYQWRYGGDKHKGIQIHRWNFKQHALALSIVLTCSGISGYLLAANTAAVWPWLDSFTTWGAVLTTWMVARKVLENWLYWIVIDTISIFLYLDRGLYATALLFVCYVILACFGYLAWLRHYRAQAGPDYHEPPSVEGENSNRKKHADLHSETLA